MSNMEMVAASPRPNNSEHDSVEVEIDINRNNETLCIAKSPLLQFWNLLGFFRRVFLYFSITILADQGYIEIPKVFRVFLQCFPLISLAIYIFRQYNSLRVIWKNKYGLLIFVGLLFSMVGDMLLSFEDGSYLFVGIGSLIRGIAWTMYTFAFQWKPFASRLLARSLLAAILFYYYLYVGGVQNAGLTIQIGGGFYIAALFTVQWRGWARISSYDLVSCKFC
ncbi:lysoplasmalogenase TMEM86A-like [Clavelina lepadiformis]|uniref:lysoplasmalogenase TMEM86A-like n=1 Tax=Clavelina lepadiformis TaxID=159417 RepID=UPI0040418DE6